MKKHVISINKWNYTTVHIIATLKILKFVKSFKFTKFIYYKCTWDVRYIEYRHQAHYVQLRPGHIYITTVVGIYRVNSVWRIGTHHLQLGHLRLPAVSCRQSSRNVCREWETLVSLMLYQYIANGIHYVCIASNKERLKDCFMYFSIF